MQQFDTVQLLKDQVLNKSLAWILYGEKKIIIGQ